MDDTLSPELYAHLASGRAINKHATENGLLVENPLFNELFVNHDAYTTLYASLGFDLRLEDDFYVLNDRSADPSMEVAMRICALLEIVSRHMASVPLNAEALLNAAVGLPRTNIVEFESVDEVNDILKACGMKGSLTKEVENNLVGRDLAFWNQRDALVLLASGKMMFEKVFANE